MSHNIYLIYELLEWFNCPKKAYFLHTQGSTDLVQCSFLREQMRVVRSFLMTHATVTKEKKGQNIGGESMEVQSQHTLDAIRSQTVEVLTHALLIHGKISVYIPHMTWNALLKGWVCYIPTVHSGIKQEHLQYASVIILICQALSIPLAKILVSSYYQEEKRYESWIDRDVLSKAHKYYEKEKNKFETLLALVELDAGEEKWESCKRQYCEMCAIESSYQVDDIRTLRKTKQLIRDLQENGISKISEIPQDNLIDNNVFTRQVQAVKTNQVLVFPSEVETFIHTLEYPRYYLDFEAFSTSIPYHYTSPYVAKTWVFTPFLFSLQWQEKPEDTIHTHLWSMLPGKNQLVQMWNALKPMLSKAGSIVVYGSQFEKDMIHRLATGASENQIGLEIVGKIRDLQEVFFNLAVYNPAQKGKISLKTITPIWLKGQNYTGLKVNEGIGANYYFTKLTDKQLRLFDDIKRVPYITSLFSKMEKAENTTVSLQDIADYCKYDTEVMIRLVALLEQYL